MIKRLTVTARTIPDGAPFAVTGRAAQTLLTLSGKGAKGITVFDFPGGVGFRLAAYIHLLKTQNGLAIEISREPHNGGSHGRWYLRSNVEIIAIDDLAKQTMAVAA
jgi:hypothetical protein